MTTVNRGEVWWVETDYGDKPYLVVSNMHRNRNLDTVLADGFARLSALLPLTVMGECTAHPPVKPGDYFTVKDGDIQVPEGGFICLWALQSLIPVLTPKEREIAEEKDLDLVEISPNSQPPVCKIMDYGKYKYQLEISEKLRKKKQSQIILKEIKMRPKIDKNDLNMPHNALVEVPPRK